MNGLARVQGVRRRTRAALRALRGAGPASSPSAPSPHELAIRRDGTDFESMRRLLAFTLGPEDSCIDIGAHRGAVLAEMVRVAPGGRHLAFEPIPELAGYLREQFPGVDVHEAAVSDAAGRTRFAHVRGSAEGWSGLRFRPLPTGEEADVEDIEVEVEVLDQVLDPELRPAVIKIDVEGAEEGVLRGAMNTLRRHRPTLIFEHGAGSAETYGTTPAGLHTLLHGLGYRIFDLDGHGPYSVEEFERTFYAAERVNFVAHP